MRKSLAIAIVRFWCARVHPEKFVPKSLCAVLHSFLKMVGLRRGPRKKFLFSLWLTVVHDFQLLASGCHLTGGQPQRQTIVSQTGY